MPALTKRIISSISGRFKLANLSCFGDHFCPLAIGLFFLTSILVSDISEISRGKI